MAKRTPNTLPREAVAANLRDLMRLRKWSEHELAKRSGVAQKTINNVLNRKSACSIETAEHLARPFNLAGWHLMIPGLPKVLIDSPTLFTLVQDWMTASDEGRDLIERLAKRERKSGNA